MRQRRDIEPNVPQHIIFRGNNRRRLFSNVSDKLAFISYLAEAFERHGCVVHAACLMSNHVHLVVTSTTRDGLSKAIKSLLQRYAIRRNRWLGATGKLFEQRFKSFAIRDEAALTAVTAYVDLNPETAGLRNDACDYAWSTARLHCHEGTSPLARVWTPSPWYLSLGATPVARAHAYRLVLSDAREHRKRLLAEAAPANDNTSSVERSDRRVLRPNNRSAR